MTTILVDTHVLLWWSVAPDRLSPRATRAIESADEVALAAVSYWELAWLAGHGRVRVSLPLRAWLADLSRGIRTAALTPVIAACAAELPATFPGDPADRLIYATAVEHGWRLVTKDGRLHAHDPGGAVVLW
jgi:PIN domain nuclease of toxin-antitoxin system